MGLQLGVHIHTHATCDTQCRLQANTTLHTNRTQDTTHSTDTAHTPYNIQHIQRTHTVNTIQQTHTYTHHTLHTLGPTLAHTSMLIPCKCDWHVGKGKLSMA